MAGSGQQVVPVPGVDVEDAAPLELVVWLCAELRVAGVSYCHWKSNEALHRSVTGENDLDLLVDRRDVPAFHEVLARCGFKEARAQVRRQVTGVTHYYGLDQPSGKFVHVDAQSHLVIGDDTTKNVRLPMDEAYLASSVQGSIFVVPAVEFELAVLVLRLALKHGTWDAAVFGLAGLSASERRELDYLWARADFEQVRRVVETHLGGLKWSVWLEYCRALRTPESLLRRLAAGRRVTAALVGFSRRAPALDTAVRCRRRVEWGIRRYAFGQRNTKRLVAGGLLIAVVGGDGAGKTTAVEALARLLGGPFTVRVVHLGKPPRSVGNLLVKGSIVAARRAGLVRRPWLPNYPTVTEHGGRFPGYAWLLWQVVTARDRQTLYRRAKRWAGQGDLVICDRFPVAQVTLMDGSRTGWIDRHSLPLPARWLLDVERRCYVGMTAPDLLLVLRVDPDIAVARKQGVDAAEFVRPRSAEVFAADWSSTTAVVLDASLPPEDVLAQLRSAVWARV